MSIVSQGLYNWSFDDLRQLELWLLELWLLKLDLRVMMWFQLGVSGGIVSLLPSLSPFITTTTTIQSGECTQAISKRVTMRPCDGLQQ